MKEINVYIKKCKKDDDNDATSVMCTSSDAVS